MAGGAARGGLSALLARTSLDPAMYPVATNVLAALITILYVKAVMEFGTFIRIKFNVPELSRKFVHLAACSFVVFWPLFDPGHWGWRLNVTVPCVMSLRLIYKGAILKDPEDEDVRSMSRTSSPSELLYGPLQMTGIMCYVGVTKFMTDTGIIIMGAFVGDWLAALVGLQYGKHKYRVPLGGEKSIEGTIGCVLGTMGGIWLYSYMCGLEFIGWRMLVVYGVTSAVVEGCALNNYDNLLLAVAMEMSAKRLPGYVFR
ncbi:hypothetical protein ACHAXT_001631 [Thalassiosira profunda]